MLGLDDYGSDSDTDRPALPDKKTQRPPKKIAISLPTLKDAESANESEDVEPPVKRQKTGAGTSSLLSMLPTPKQVNPVLPAPRRVPGRGGTVFHFRPPSMVGQDEDGPTVVAPEQISDVPEESTTTLFRPTSLTNGKKNVSVEAPGINISKPPPQKSLPPPNVDFFSLGEFNTPCYFVMPYDLQEQLSPLPKRPYRNLIRFLMHRQPPQCPHLSLQSPHPQIRIPDTIFYRQGHGPLMMNNTMRHL